MFKVYGLLALLLAAHAPFLLSYFQLMWEHDHYGFFPFAIAGLAWFFLQRHNKERFHWNRICTILVGADVLLVVLGVSMPSPWPVMAGLNCSLIALLIAGRDKVTGTSLGYLGFLALTLLRIPLGLDQRVISELQRRTTLAASDILHKLRFVHFRAGNVIEFVDKTLMVEEACSGIQSLFTVIFCAAFIIGMRRRMLFHSLILMASAVFWALCFNVVRIVGIAVAWKKFDMDLTLEPQHSIWGYVVLVGAIAILYCTDCLIDFLLSYVPDPVDDSEVYRNPFAEIWNGLFQQQEKETFGKQKKMAPPPNTSAPWLLKNPLVALVVAGIAIAGQITPSIAALEGAKTRAESRPDILMEDDLPADLNAWKKIDYKLEMRREGNSFGQYSNQWNYQREGNPCIVACDHAFRGWHNLESCYVARGWDIAKREVVFMADADWPAVKVHLTKPTSEQAVLVYSLFDGDGIGAVPPQASADAALFDRLFRKGQLGGQMVDPLLYQSQVFLQIPSAPDEKLEEELLREHSVARELMRKGYLERHRG